MPLTLVQTIAPYAEPVSLDEAKTYLRVDFADQDAVIGGLVATARAMAEQFTNRQYVAATYRYSLDHFPYSDSVNLYRRISTIVPSTLERKQESVGQIELPRPPIAAVSSVQYVDAAGVLQTWAAAGYLVDADSEPARLMPAYGLCWPESRLENNAVRVTYVAGYACPFTVNAATDVLTAKGRTYADGERVRLSNSGGALPAGLAADTDYYVVSSTGATFKLAQAAGGAAIDITGAGTGTHFLGEIPPAVKQAMKLMLGALYEHRDGQIPPATMDAFESLLWPQRIISRL